MGFKFKRGTLWGIIIAVIIISIIVAFVCSKNNSAREMATGAFSGAIIGALILIYEEMKEERREQHQEERDINLANKLREDANRGSDVRSCADILLKELKPKTEKYLKHYMHETSRGWHCSEFMELRNDIRPLIETARFYVRRVKDRELNDKFEEFNSTFLKHQAILSTNWSNRKNDAKRKPVENNAIIILGGLVFRAEQLLQEPHK